MVFFYRRKEELSFNAMKKTKQVLSYILEDVSTNNVRARVRVQAVLVLEVVFSAFCVSDDTEFEFIELCRKYRVRLLFLDFKSSILHKT